MGGIRGFEFPNTAPKRELVGPRALCPAPSLFFGLAPKHPANPFFSPAKTLLPSTSPAIACSPALRSVVLRLESSNSGRKVMEVDSSQGMLLSGFPSDIWRHTCPFLDENDAERLLMIGSRRLTQALSHLRVDLKALWISPKFMDLSPLWLKWPLLNSISIRALRPSQLVAWPVGLETVPKSLQNIHFEFRHCIELFFNETDLKASFPLLERLYLSDQSKQPALKNTISLANLPTSLRSLCVKSEDWISYPMRDITKLPVGLETFDIQLYPRNDSSESWNESEEERFAAEAHFPCRSLTYLHAPELYVHLRNLPTTLTHISIKGGDILDFLHNPNAQKSTLLQSSRTSISLNELFPKLAYLNLETEEGIPHSILSDVPPTLTHVDLPRWGDFGPKMNKAEVLKMVDKFASQVRFFSIEMDDSFLPSIALRLPNIGKLTIMEDSKPSDLSSLTNLKKLDASLVESISKLPPNLTYLECSELDKRLFSPKAEIEPFPNTLRTFRYMNTLHNATSSLILALPSTLTHLEISFGSAPEPWQALSKHLTELEVLEASGDPPESAGCPPTAALLPRRLRLLTISAESSKSGKKGSKAKPDTSIDKTWFREGLVDLIHLKSLAIMSNSAHEDLASYLPPSLKELKGPRTLISPKAVQKLPRNLEKLGIDAHYFGSSGMKPIELTAEILKHLPQNLTHFEAPNSSGTSVRAIVESLPPHLSHLNLNSKVVDAYYLRQKVLAKNCYAVLVKFDPTPAKKQQAKSKGDF